MTTRRSIRLAIRVLILSVALTLAGVGLGMTLYILMTLWSDM